MPFDSARKIECGIDLRQVEALSELMSQHMTVPNIDTSSIEWKQEARSWTMLPQWTFHSAWSLHFYTDGSNRGERGSASAVPYVFDGWQWFFGGYCQHRLEDGGTNFTSELFGSLIALKWAWDLIRCFAFHGFETPETVMHYDCLASGLITEGRWQGVWNDSLHKAVRALFQMIEQTFKIEIV